MKNTANDSYTVIACNVKFKDQKKLKKEVPEFLYVDIPEGIVRMQEKNKSKFLDDVETYVYNNLTRRYGNEVYTCQIWLP